MNPQIIWNNKILSKILHVSWNADLAMDGDYEKLKMKKKTIELGSEQLPLRERVQLVGEIFLMHNTTW